MAEQIEGKNPVLEALRAKPHPGRRARMTSEQKQELEEVLLRGAQGAGYATDLWTLSRVTEVIERRFGVTYHPGHVWYILRDMGWSCQKPERRARERDEEAIAGWRKEEWPRVKKRPERTAGALDLLRGRVGRNEAASYLKFRWLVYANATLHRRLRIRRLTNPATISKALLWLSRG